MTRRGLRRMVVCGDSLCVFHFNCPLLTLNTAAARRAPAAGAACGRVRCPVKFPERPCGLWMCVHAPFLHQLNELVHFERGEEVCQSPLSVLQLSVSCVAA